MQDDRQLVAENLWLQAQIHEPWASRLGARHVFAGGQRLDEGGGDLRGLAAREFGNDERRIGRHVAVRRIARRRDLDFRGEIIGEIGNYGMQRGEHVRAHAAKKILAHGRS